MRPGWYIVTYHDVDYEDSLMTRALGATTRPDVFAAHLEQLARAGTFVSIARGHRMLESGERPRRPLFSLWFDDGFAGVVEHALPLCARHGIRPAMSICSRFVLRQEMSWRAKLSYLAHTDGLRLLRARLRGRAPAPPRLRAWSLEHFSEALVAAIDAVYRELSPAHFRRDAFRIFATENDVRTLADAGWTITNHSAAHYPVREALGWDAAFAQFDECASLVARYNRCNPYWVVPFGSAPAALSAQLPVRATLVEGGDRRNTVDSWRRSQRLSRFFAPGHRDLLAALA